jgi:hypothetical protein
MGIAVIDMRVLVNVEMRSPPGIQPDLKISLRVDLFDGSELAISKALVPVRRGELHAVTSRKDPFRLPANTHPVQPVRVVGEMLAVLPFDGE